MKRSAILATLLVALVPTPTLALDLTVKIRDTSEARAIILCDEIRTSLSKGNTLPGSWTLSQCATTVFARALQAMAATTVQESALTEVRAAVADSLAAAKQGFPDDGADPAAEKEEEEPTTDE